MDIEAAFKSIRNVYQTVSGKSDADPSLTYKGTALGQTKPWHARIDTYEFHHQDHIGALTGLLSILKEKLAAKTASAEYEATRLRKALSQLEN